MQKEVETKKVLIVYHYFAHYRLPIMKELANENSVEFSFLSGDTSDINIEKEELNFLIGSNSMDGRGEVIFLN